MMKMMKRRRLIEEVEHFKEDEGAKSNENESKRKATVSPELEFLKVENTVIPIK